MQFEYPQQNTLTIASPVAASYSQKQEGDRLYQEFKNPRQAENVLLDAINAYTVAAEMSDDPAIVAQMAKAYMLNGQFDQTRKYLERLAQMPNLDDATMQSMFETQAMLNFHYGNLEQTERLLTEALKFNRFGQKSNVRLALGVIQLHQNRTRFSLKRGFQATANLALGALSAVASKSLMAFKPYAQTYGTMWLNRLRSPELALDNLIALYQQFPGIEILPIEIGKRYAQKELYVEAEFWFSRAMVRHPSRDDGYRYLVNLYQVTGNTDMLIETLEKWLAIRPQNGEIMSALSQAYANDPENLQASLKMAMQSLIYTQNPNLLANTYTHIGNLYSAVQSFDAAVTAYQAALNANPYNLDAYVQLGTLYYDKQEYALSQKIFEKALALSPNNAKILCNLGYLAWMQGNIQESQTYYEQSIELDPTYDIALNNLGVLYMDHIGNMEKAMALFDQTLLYNPNYALCYYNKGRAFSFLGKNIEAARCFTIAQDLNQRSQELDNAELTERIKQLFENERISND